MRKLLLGNSFKPRPSLDRTPRRHIDFHTEGSIVKNMMRALPKPVLLLDPYFSFQRQILFTIISTLSKNEQKCHLAAARRMKLWSLNGNSFFKELQQLTKFTLMCPLKRSLVENISLQRCNCNIFRLTDTVALFAKEAGFFQI